MSGWRARGSALGLAALLAIGASGCSAPEPAATPAPVPTSSAPSATVEPPALPAGEPTVIATGLSSPWSVVRLASGSALVSERDTGLVKEITAEGEVRVVGEVPGVQPGGEGGLLGLAVQAEVGASTGSAGGASTGSATGGGGASTGSATESGSATETATPEPGGPWLYAYFTAESDNRIARLPLDGGAGSYSLGEPEDVLTGIPKAGNHDGGRLAFGPDGMLYATTGDANDRDAAQNGSSLGGKILRMMPTGEEPDDNPFPGSLVYTLGHRNPQGITWDATGQMWAAEFGQNTWDELNAIKAGGNYGWPVVEGAASDPAFQNPTAQWSTDEASPSGLAFTRGTLFLAALRGERLWSVTTIDGAQSQPWFVGAYGRIRDVVPGPDGTLWMLTSNTDGRGDVRDGDDRLLQVPLAPAPSG
jgi:glucose/arabinose dehydrogenase